MENGPKILPPSLRTPKRYMVFAIIAEHPVSYSGFVSAVWSKMFEVVGELGASRMGMWVIENMYDAEKQRGVIKCSLKHVEEMRVILTLINIIDEIKVIVKVLGVTGTIKSAQKKYLGIKDLTIFSKP
ncbi:MAG: Rpp14/Pop5 family protein [Candidatus Aenigmatarchaeota archaeon]